MGKEKRRKEADLVRERGGEGGGKGGEGRDV